MDRKPWLLGVILLLAATTLAHAQPALPPRDGFEPVAERLSAWIEGELIRKNIPAASIALVAGGRIVWAKGFGLARPEDKIPATAETVYRVGSVSKLFTDLAAMQLVEAGRLDLDAPVAKYLPDFTPGNPFGAPITTRLLMSHRSGMARETPLGHYFDPSPPGLAGTVLSLNQTALVYPPGERVKYSNAGVSVVGRIVEKLRDEPFAETVQETVITPFGMTNAGFEMTPEIEKAMAIGQMWTYDGRTFNAPTFGLGTNAAGNLYASVFDLGRFLVGILNEGRGPSGPVVKPETLRSMWEVQGTHDKNASGYGLGFHVSSLDGRKRVGHGGAVYGFATELAALPDEGLGVAVVFSKDFVNACASQTADMALRLLLDRKHGRPLKPLVVTGPVPADLAQRLEGTYGEGEQRVELTARGGKLFLAFARGGFRLELRTVDGELVTDDALGQGFRVRPEGDSIEIAGGTLRKAKPIRPEPPPRRWEGLIGEYGWDHDVLYILEQDGRLYSLIEWFYYDPLEEIDENVFEFPDRGFYSGETLRFVRDAQGRATSVNAANVVFKRRRIDGDDGSTFRIKPQRPAAELRKEALAAQPPEEKGEFRAPDLVDLAAIDPSVKLDIRYATDNNFVGVPFYASARAFLQRPAAEALGRVHRGLRDHGFGLLIHDAYRPWHVTRMFWDATPLSGRGFVADPSKGSKHNRGCAVDLTLYDRETGKAVAMVGGYDEFSARSSPDYPGGTSLQRWRRDLLRRAMEHEGFTVNEVEWWHFDYKDWPAYPILNAPFEALDLAKPQ